MPISKYATHPAGAALALGSALALWPAVSSAAIPSFSYAQSGYTVVEGQSAVATITRSSTTGSATVSWGTMGVTATKTSDYSGVDWTPVTFAAGESSKSVSVRTVDDSSGESAETFDLVLSAPSSGYVIRSPATTRVTISDNDGSSPPVGQAAAFTFATTAYSVTEGGLATATITRTPSTGTATVSWGTRGITATKVADYTGYDPTAVTFAAGESSKTISVPTADDSSAEPAETFDLVLSSPSTGYALGSPASARVTISDNDGGSPPVSQKSEIAFSASAYSVTEGGLATATITRTPSTGTATVSWGTRGITATKVVDYVGYDPTTVTFAAGESSKTVSVKTVDDSTGEPAETFDLVLSTPSAGYTLGTQATARVTIADNDSTTPPPVGAGSASLSWVAPSARVDGSPLSLSELDGYRIYYGPSSGNLGTKVDVTDPSNTTYTVGNLATGTYYFAVTAYDNNGVESARSNVASKTIQ